MLVSNKEKSNNIFDNICGDIQFMVVVIKTTVIVIGYDVLSVPLPNEAELFPLPNNYFKC